MSPGLRTTDKVKRLLICNQDLYERLVDCKRSHIQGQGCRSKSLSSHSMSPSLSHEQNSNKHMSEGMSAMKGKGKTD